MAVDQSAAGHCAIAGQLDGLLLIGINVEDPLPCRISQRETEHGAANDRLVHGFGQGQRQLKADITQDLSA